MRKPWQLAALGLPFLLAAALAAPQPDAAAAGECGGADAPLNLVLLQYWFFAVAFLLSSVSTACRLAPDFARAWRLDVAWLSAFRRAPLPLARA